MLAKVGSDDGCVDVVVGCVLKLARMKPILEHLKCGIEI